MNSLIILFVIFAFICLIGSLCLTGLSIWFGLKIIALIAANKACQCALEKINSPSEQKEDDAEPAKITKPEEFVMLPYLAQALASINWETSFIHPFSYAYYGNPAALITVNPNGQATVQSIPSSAEAETFVCLDDEPPHELDTINRLSRLNLPVERENVFDSIYEAMACGETGIVCAWLDCHETTILEGFRFQIDVVRSRCNDVCTFIGWHSINPVNFINWNKHRRNYEKQNQTKKD